MGQVIDAYAGVYQRISRLKVVPLTFRNMRPAITSVRVLHIDIFGRHIEITPDDGRQCDVMP